MSHSNKDKSSLSWKINDKFNNASGGRVGVCPSTTHFSYLNVYFGRDRHDWGIRTYHCHQIARPVVSSWIREYQVNATGGSSFGVSDCGVKGGVDPMTTQLSYHSYNFCRGGGDYLSSHSRYYLAMICLKKYRSFFPSYQRGEDKFITAGDVGGVVGTKTTHLFSHKFGFGIHRHY